MSGFVAGCLLAAAPARATPVTVSFTGTCATDCSTDGPDANSRVYTFYDGQGLASRVNITAWSASQNTSDGSLSNFQTAFLGQYSGSSGGLGVTNRNEGDGSSNNSHTADNYQGIDLIVLHFDGNVVATGAQLNAFAMTATGFSGSGSDTDATFFIGTTTTAWGTAINVADAVQQSQLSQHMIDTTGDNTSGFRSVNADTRYIGNTFVIVPSIADYARGTYGGNRPDAFKVGSVTVEYDTNLAPEPAAFGLLGLGVLGIAARRARRKPA